MIDPKDPPTNRDGFEWTAHERGVQESAERKIDRHRPSLEKLGEPSADPPTPPASQDNWFERQRQRTERDIKELPDWLRSKPTLPASVLGCEVLPVNTAFLYQQLQEEKIKNAEQAATIQRLQARIAELEGKR